MEDFAVRAMMAVSARDPKAQAIIKGPLPDPPLKIDFYPGEELLAHFFLLDWEDF